MGSKRLQGLDALRGVAAMLVVIGHIQLFSKTYLLRFTYGLSVDFFFMLSGYVMARTYETRMLSGLTAWSFLRVRFRRLWPVMTIGTLLGFALSMARSEWSVQALPALAAVLMFLPYHLKPGWLYPFNGPSWSITNELLANFVHAAVLARMNERHLMIAMLTASGYFIYWILHGGGIPVGGVPHMILPAIARTFMSYIIGILLYRRFGQELNDQGQKPEIGVRLSILVAGLTLCVLLTAFLPFWMPIVFILIISPLLVVSGAHCRISPGAARWAMASGAISFPLYAVHEPLVMVLIKLVGPLSAALIASTAVFAVMACLALRRERHALADA